MTAEHAERVERNKEVSESISSATTDRLYDQGKKVAANMLLLYGDKSCLSATGFIYCVQGAHEAALLWLLSEGIVVLADEAKASDEERAARNAPVEATQQGTAPHLRAVPDAGAYL